MSSEKPNQEQVNNIETSFTDLSAEEATNIHKLGVDDPIVYREMNTTYVGKVTNLYAENGVIKLAIQPYGLNKDAIIVKANDPKLDPLFFKNNNTNAKTYLKFSYNEIKTLLKKDVSGNNKIFNLSWQDLAENNKSYNSLMLGNRTAVFENIQTSKTREIEGKQIIEKFTKPARLELRRSKSGNAYVHAEFKNQSLNLDAPLYGRNFTDAEKKQLTETSELGLVEGFTNTSTGEIYNLWVSVDPALNKIVTRRENDIYLDAIYGKNLNDTQKNTLKKGGYITLEFKKTNGEKFKNVISVSAGSTRNNGIKSFSEEKAKELGLIEDQKKKQTKNRGPKVGA